MIVSTLRSFTGALYQTLAGLSNASAANVNVWLQQTYAVLLGGY